MLTAAIVAGLSHLTGFSLFTYSFLGGLIPVGALITGAAAASGYAFGGLFFHEKVSRTLLFQMMAIAAATQFTIYFLDYQMLMLEDGRHVSDLVAFNEYLMAVLTKSHYSLKGHDIGELGAFGYLVGAVQFIGFLAGGMGVYGYLAARPFCQSCNLYLQKLGARQVHFSDPDEANNFYAGFLSEGVSSKAFATRLSADTKVRVKKGVIRIQTKLYGCPGCGAQRMVQTVEVFDGSLWKEIDGYGRTIAVPQGRSMLKAFKA